MSYKQFIQEPEDDVSPAESLRRLRNCAFVDFKDEMLANQALSQLNRLRCLGKVLTVERASHGNLKNSNQHHHHQDQLFPKLCGMTGTAATESTEFESIYKLKVTIVPTNKPMIRKDESDVVFRATNGKWRAVLVEISRMNKTGSDK